MKHFIGLTLLTLSVQSFADDSHCQPQVECVEVGQWELSLAVGAGGITNPLFEGDDIPLLLVPYISYYNDKLFFDNSTLGYTLVEAPNYDISLVTELNGEKKFFSRFHPANIIAPSGSLSEGGKDVIDEPVIDSGNPTGPSEGLDTPNENIDPDPNDKPVKPATPISFKDLANRSWALDAGVLIHAYFGERHKFTAQWMHDVSGQYQGQHVLVSYKFQAPLPQSWPAKLQLSVGGHWKSAELIEHYYGINAQDNLPDKYHYQGESGLSPFVGVAFNYKINESWQFKFSAKREFLSDEISNSPLVEEDVADTFFVGGLYAFDL